jgi:hypothetical protein
MADSEKLRRSDADQPVHSAQVSGKRFNLNAAPGFSGYDAAFQGSLYDTGPRGAVDDAA